MRIDKWSLAITCIALAVFSFTVSGEECSQLDPAVSTAEAEAGEALRFLQEIPPGTEPGPGVFGDGCYGYCTASITCNYNGSFLALSCTGWSSCEEYATEVHCDGNVYTCEQCYYTFQRTCEYC